MQVKEVRKGKMDSLVLMEDVVQMVTMALMVEMAPREQRVMRDPLDDQEEMAKMAFQVRINDDYYFIRYRTHLGKWSTPLFSLVKHRNGAGSIDVTAYTFNVIKMGSPYFKATRTLDSKIVFFSLVKRRKM